MENYKIIGGDGREYGPVNLDELLHWIGDGRVGRDTMIWSEQRANWVRAESLPELQPELDRLYQRLPPPLPAQDGRPVGFFARLAAYIMDHVVLWMLFSLLWVLVTRFVTVTEPTAREITTPDDLRRLLDEFMPFFLLQMAIYTPLHFAYDVFLNGRFGATLGKMLIGARIVRTSGEAIGYGTASTRWLGARLSDLLCYAGYFFIVFREDKRALHDLIANTKVIYRR